MDPAVTRAITEIPEEAWTPIKYARAIFDEQENRWVSDAQVAEIAFTAFTSHKKSEHIGARLIVRRVKRLNPTTVPAGQGERRIPVNVATPRGVGGRDGICTKSSWKARAGAVDGATSGVHHLDHQGGQQLRAWVLVIVATLI